MMPPFSVDLPAMVNVITGMAATMPKVHFASKITLAKLFSAITVLPFCALR